MSKTKKKKVYHKYPVYDGEHLLEFEPSAHEYYLDGLLIPSVTGILDIKSKPALRYWAINETLKCIEKTIKPGKAYSKQQIDELLKLAKRASDRVSQKALDVGSMVHDWIEQYIKFCIEHDTPPEITEPEDFEIPGVMFLRYNNESRSSINAFIEWTKSHDVKFIGTEEKIVSLKDRWAGTMDTRAIIDDRLGVWDWKTSKAIYPEYFVQTATYANGHQEMGADPYDDLWILRVPKDGGEFEAKNHTQLRVQYSIQDLYSEVFLSCKKIYDFNDGKKRRIKKSPGYVEK